MALLKLSTFFDAVTDEIEFSRKCLLQPKFEPLVPFLLGVFYNVFFNTKIITADLRAFWVRKSEQIFLSTRPFLWVYWVLGDDGKK